MSWISPLWRRVASHRGPALATLREGRFVALDLETTGLDARRDAIVAAAAIEFVAGEPRPVYVSLVNPRRPIPATSTAVHGITDAMVRDAPLTARALAQLTVGLGDGLVAGHGIAFDLAILRRECRVAGLPPVAPPALDTMKLVSRLFPAWDDVSLDAAAARLGVEVCGRHTAEGDAIAAGRLLLALLPRLEGVGFRTIPEVMWFQESSGSSR
jgi:DNA polymerase III epsilon subunit-like protein